MKKNKFVIGIALLAAVMAGLVMISKSGVPSFQVSSQKGKDVYYCPMHPTYTSDRPGDCPICNMKLVKKETTTAPQPFADKVSKKIQDICYLHNCPKVHEGKPCPMLVVAKEGESVTCPICGTHVAASPQVKKERKILYWTDPMIPGYKSDKPGKSPMGMDMVPVYPVEGEKAPLYGVYEEGIAKQSEDYETAALLTGYAPILITPQKQQLIGIKTDKVERRTLTKTIRTVGTIAHDPELYQAQAEYIQAILAYNRAQQSSIPEVLDQSRRLLEATKIRLKHLGLSAELIDEIATQKEPEHGLLFSHPGEPVWMYAQIYEYELPLIHVGQNLLTEVPALAGQDFNGVIRAIDPMVEAMTRTTRIRAQLQDPKGDLKPGMYVNVTIQVDLGEALTVPQEAVFNTGTKQIVFVDKGQGLLEPRDVTLGAKADQFYQIKEGLKEGEMVVTSGNFLIDSESRLKAALEGMGPSDSPQGSTTTPEGSHTEGSHGGHQHGQ